MENKTLHEPVMVEEIIAGFLPLAHSNNSLKIIDATLGTGGTSQALLDQGYKVLGIEADEEMLLIAKKHLKGDITVVHGNFKDLKSIAKTNNFSQVDGLVFDLGVSNLQLTSLERGFSFSEGEAPLDMRIDRQTQSLTAADLLNVLRPDQLTVLFSRVLKPWESKKLVAEIVKVREYSKFTSVSDLLAVCSQVRTKPGLNRATLPFLALRIAVNSELENLEYALPQAAELIRLGGRMLIIYFHSLERNLVNKFIKSNKEVWKEINPEPIAPGFAEVSRNPKARSARLVILEKYE